MDKEKPPQKVDVVKAEEKPEEPAPEPVKKPLPPPEPEEDEVQTPDDMKDNGTGDEDEVTIDTTSPEQSDDGQDGDDIQITDDKGNVIDD